MSCTPDTPEAGATDLCDDNHDENLGNSFVFWGIAAVAAVAVASNFSRDRHSVKIKKQNCSKLINLALFSVFSVSNFD